MRPLYAPREGICSRGWLFLGEQGGPCDKTCEMCYYAWQTHLVFYSQETLLQIANLFRHAYELDACDITGGEPTICPSLGPLTRHCRRIGLRPTVITHGQNLTEAFFQKVHKQALADYEHDLEDWLISLHGDTPAVHDAILGSRGSYDRLVGNLDGLTRPVRFNTTLMDTNVGALPVATLLRRPPTVWNLIMFNPFHAWSTKREIDFQVRYTEAHDRVATAVHDLEAEGWEVNVRYWPLCLADGFRRNVCGFHQVPYDPWEWRLSVTQRIPPPVIERAGGWEAAERQVATRLMAGRDNPVCQGCAWRAVCDKPPEQYQRRYGLEELRPASGSAVTDPCAWGAT